MNILNIKLLKHIRNSLFKFSYKKLHDIPYTEKSLKWYWREKNYDMYHGERYKFYEIIRRDGKKSGEINLDSLFPSANPQIELIPINKQYDSCLIWLYDGDHPEMFIEALLEHNNFPPKNYKIVIFNAPVNPITFDSNTFERSWFNIFNFPDAAGRRDIKKAKIDDYTKLIHNEISRQYSLIGDYSKIFLGGFSQSGCMATYSCLTYKENVGGCISFCGFSFDFTPLEEKKKKIPFLFINGVKDQFVIIRHARESYSKMIKLGYNVKYIEEPGLFHHFSKTGLNHANQLLI